MSEFIAGLTGAIVGGALSLVGVWLTLNKQAERDRKNDQRMLRDRRHDRLRDVYREVVAASDAHVGGALRLAMDFDEASRMGMLEEVMESLLNDHKALQEAHAQLRLESEEDRVLLDLLEAIDRNRSALLTDALDRPGVMPFADFERGVTDLGAQAEELAKLARERLAALEQPVF